MSAEKKSKFTLTSKADIIGYLILIVILFFTYLTSLYSFLLFHTIAELFSIIIAGGVFVIGWNSRKYMKSSFFLVMGISFLFIGIVDLLHTLAYKGMGIFTEYDANLPTQLWILGRYIQAASFLIAVWCIKKTLKPNRVLSIYLVITIIGASLIFLRLFPDCYIEGTGLTAFKIISEYIIDGILLLGIIHIYYFRRDFNKRIFFFIVFSILATIISEIIFTFYISVFDISNVMGHIAKIIAFFFVYKAIIETGLKNPFSLLFRKLKKSEEALNLKAKDLEKAYSEVDQIFNAALPLRIIDKNCEIVKVNQTFCSLFKVKPEDILGKKCYEEMPHKYCHTESCSMQQILKGSSRVEYEIEYIYKEGKNITLRVNTVPHRNQNGEFLGIIQNYTNITDRIITEQKLIESEQSLRETQKELSIKNQIANSFLSIDNDQLYPEVLDLILKAMDSQYGVFGYIDENGNFIAPSMTKYIWDQCEMAGKTIFFSQETWGGIWGRAMKNMEPRYSNIEFKVPEGHLPISNALDVPIIYNEELVGNILVGNKEGGYSDEDMEKLKRIANYIAPLLHDRLISKIAQEEVKNLAKFPSENPNPIIRVDHEKVIFSNPSGKMIFNVNSGSKIPDELTQVIEEVYKTQLIKQLELELNNQFYSFTVTPVPEENYLNIYGLNITDRVKAENRIKNIVSTVSHELRTPITVLLMSLELVKQKEGNLTSELKDKIIETEERNLSLLKDLSEDLLTISRIDEKKVELELQEYNLFGLLEDILTFFTPFCQEKSISFNINVPNNITLKGDIRRIDQVFRIMLDNAIKYSNENSLIKINAINNYQGKYNPKGVDGVLIEIIDQGIGIDKEDLPHIFERFYRASSAKKTSGTGLGLSIAKELIQIHQGEVYIESEIEKGTTFSIFLPRLNTLKNKI